MRGPAFRIVCELRALAHYFVNVILALDARRNCVLIPKRCGNAMGKYRWKFLYAPKRKKLAAWRIFALYLSLSLSPRALSNIAQLLPVVHKMPLCVSLSFARMHSPSILYIYIRYKLSPSGCEAAREKSSPTINFNLESSSSSSPLFILIRSRVDE